MEKMTKPEEIEALLNVFGETIKDLPKPIDVLFSGPVYDSNRLIKAKKRCLAFFMDEWEDTDLIPEIKDDMEATFCDYVCHQSDVIERLVRALETAKTKLTPDRNLEDTDAVRIHQANI